MKALLIGSGFICFDVLTGFLKAAKNKNWNSTPLRKGMYNKAGEFLTMIAAYGLEYAAVELNLGWDIPAAGAAIAYVCIMEGVSIMENLCELSPGLRKLFGPYLEKLKGGENNGK